MKQVVDYVGVVRRIVDGDTLILDINLAPVIMPCISILPPDYYIQGDGMLTIKKVRCRLWKFYAEEMGTVAGVEAKDRLSLLLPIDTEIQFSLHGKDKYGRWLITPMIDGVNVSHTLTKAGNVAAGRGISTTTIHQNAVPDTVILLAPITAIIEPTGQGL